MNQDPNAAALLELLREAKEQVQFLGELGVESIGLTTSVKASEPVVTATPMATVPKPPLKPKPLPALPSPTGASQSWGQTPKNVASGAGAPPESALFNRMGSAAPASAETLEQIWQDIGECTRCGLCEGRTQVVNTHGNRRARLMFVGEAPGADEDAQGKPFVGRAGQLLTKMIEAMGIKREDVIIGNVNRCRPPGNRQPTLEEAAICRPFLFREIAVVQPEIIVVMGNTALRNLLEVREGISRVRGKFQDFRGIKVMPTFHPAYLLRDPSKKRETWEDLKQVMDYLQNTPAKSD